MNIYKCLTTIENAPSAVSRVALKLMQGEKRRPLFERGVIWSALHSDMQRLVNQAEKCLHHFLNKMSCDVCLGLPFNIASYAFLTHMIAQQTDLEVGELIISFGDVHMYVDHVDGYNIQRQRDTRPLPSLKLNKAASIFDYKLEDFVVEMYEPWPNIKFPIAV